MKNFEVYKKQLIEQYQIEVGELKEAIDAKVVAEAEIVLYMLEVLGFVGEDISKGWSFLVGYMKPQAINTAFTERERKLIAKARGYLPMLKGSTSYRLLINQYLEWPKSIRLYHILEREEGSYLKIIQPSEFPKRKEVLKNLFEAPIQPKEQEVEIFTKGTAYVAYDNIMERIKIPTHTLSSLHEPRKTIRRVGTVQPIRVTKQALLETAQQMDQKTSTTNYTQRVENIFFDVLKEDNYEEAEAFTIDGLFNLVGRVGAGKSTLVEVLTTYLAWQGKITGLVVNSIQDSIKLCELFSDLDIEAVPLWGYSNRKQNIQKALNKLEEQDLEDVTQFASNKWLAEICPLDGLRTDSEIKESFETGKEPCMRLRENRKNPRLYICPYYNQCPSHAADLSLEQARVFITTPGAFISTKVSPAVIANEMRISEYLYYRCNLVVFDESDRVQANFDSCFSDTIVLMDQTSQSYLNRIGVEVERWWYERRVQNASNEKNIAWYNHFTTAQKMGNLIIYLLMENQTLLKKVEGRYYTAHTLLEELYEVIGDDIKERTSLDELKDFIRKSRIDKNSLFYSQVYEKLLAVESEEKAIYKIIKEWMKEKEENLSGDGNALMVYIIISSIFEKHLRAMINGISEIYSLRPFNLEELSVFYKPIKDYLAFIPMSPMGNLFGFRISTDENKQLKRITLFKASGVGRWLLNHYHCLFEETEHVKGPNVLLLSGTSWAPKAYSYHIEHTAHAILKGTEQDIEAISKSTFRFEGLKDKEEVISVSGKQGKDRIRDLQKILYALFRKPAGLRQNVTLIEKELQKLPEKRRKILLLVGSYEEAKEAKSYLDKIVGATSFIRGDEIQVLVQDDAMNIEEDALMRGDIEKFGQNDAKVLIAPLMSVERGHNILNEQQEAAIGSVYFLIRPMPVPNDMNVIVQKLNSSFMQQLNQVQYRHAGEYAQWVKAERDKAMRRMQMLIIESEQMTYRTMETEERRALCMNLFVSLCQVIGRLVRGGCEARVHFCDGAFAPLSLKGEEDTEKTSILVGMIQVLRDYLEEDGIASQQDKTIAYQLYSAFYKGLKECEGLKYGRK